MRKYFKGMSTIIAFVFILSIIFNYSTLISFGSNNPNYIEVEAIGTGTTGSTMFSQGLWGPGSQQEGVLRLKNNYTHRVKVTNLALTMKLEKYTSEGYQLVNDADLYKLYAENMHLKITRGYLLVFEEDIYNGDFFNMLFEAGNFQHEGYPIPSGEQFNVNRNDTVDLRYTITMNPEAGNELQGLKATVDFIINLHENPIPVEGGDTDSETDPEDPQLEVVEDNQIPLGQHWAHDCIVKLMEEGIVQGYPDGSIQADKPITRAETAAIIARALKLEDKSALLTGYLDPVPSWARGAIIATTEAEIFKGYPVIFGKVFRGNNLITREEMATVLMRAFKLDLEAEKDLEFIDNEDISDWSLEYIKIGVEKEIITGYPDNSFKPKDYITRGEAFTMICKLLGYHTEH